MPFAVEVKAILRALQKKKKTIRLRIVANTLSGVCVRLANQHNLCDWISIDLFSKLIYLLISFC